MASRVRHVRFRTPEVSALLDLFHGLQLEGVRLEPQADGESRNLQPLQAALKNAKALSPLDGPLPAAIDALRLMSDSKLHQNDEETIWQTLSDEGIIMDTVVELLHQLSETETGPLALSAASLYFALLRIPGAFMYRVFSAYAFRICLSAVKKWIYTVADLKPKKKTRGASQKGEDKDEEVDENEAPTLSGALDTTPPSLLLACIKTVSQLANGASFNNKSDGYAALLEVAIELSRITCIRAPASDSRGKNKSSAPTLLSNSEEVVAEIWDIAYTILGGLTKNSHGGNGSVSIVVRALLPSLMMTAFPAVSTTIPREVQQVRKRVVAFFSTLIDEADGDFSLHNALQLLLHHICMDIPDKAEYRHAAHATVSELLAKLSSTVVKGKKAELQHCARFLSFLLKYGRHKKPIYRLFAAELVEELLLNEKFTTPTVLQTSIAQNTDADIDGASMDLDVPVAEGNTIVFSESDHLELLGHLASFLIERSSDKIVNVRSKALSALASTLERANLLLESRNGDTSDLTQYEKAIRKVYFAVEAGPNTPRAEEGVAPKTPLKSPLNGANAAPSPSIFKTPDPKPIIARFSMVSLISKRLEDERSTVRKSALQLLEMLCRYDRLERLAHVLDMFKNSCFDPLLIIRKQASVSLTNLLALFPKNERLMLAWVQSVPVLVFDGEQSVQEASVKSFIELVLNRLLECKNGKDFVSFDKDPSAWQLFDLVTNTGSDTTGKTIGKICSLLAQDADYSKLARKFVKVLMLAVPALKTQAAMEVDSSDAMTDERRKSLELACWKALAWLATNSNILAQFDVDFVLEQWNLTKDDDTANVDIQLRILQTMAALVAKLDEKKSSSLVCDLQRRLRAFKVTPPIIQASSQLIIKLTDQIHGGSTARATALNANLKWMGELLVLAEAQFADIVIPSDQNEIAKAFTGFASLDALLFTVGEVAQFLQKNSVPARLVTLLQTFIAPAFKGIVSKSQDGDMNAKVTLTIPPATKALAFVSLGKLCLQDQTLAKTCITAFARELEVSTSSIVRNNVMVVMCDLVVRYSNLVDNYLGKLAICLRDESELVRRQTLLMLTNLLQEEFIKLKQGNILFPLLLTLVDDSEVLRQFALLCLEGILSKHGGASHVFFSNFVEVIFFLNDYRMHPQYNQFPYSARERQVFSLGASRQKRFTIYKVLFDHMEDQHKYQVSFRLCEEVIQGVLDGALPLEGAQNLLYDVLCILSSEEIRLKQLGAKTAAKELYPEQLEDDITNAKAENQKKIAEATGALAVQVVKRTTIERIVPIMIDLKGLLARNHSPLLKNVMDYLSDLTKDMPDEMSEVLENNKQLAMELAYETRLQRALASNKRGVDVAEVDGNDENKQEEDETMDASEAIRSLIPNKKNKSAAAARRAAQSLIIAATAPTPWKRNAPDISDFAMPKLRTGATPYKPSPARVSAHIEKEDAIPLPAFASPHTPKAAKPSKNITPSTPGDISSPMVARIKHANIEIRTPISAKLSSPSDPGQSSVDDIDIDAERPRNAKRPHFVDSDSENNSPSENARANARLEEPSSPTAKKPLSKRAKVIETDPEEEVAFAPSSTEVTPAKPRPKRQRD